MTTKHYLNGYKLGRASNPNSNKQFRVVRDPPLFNDEIELIVNKKYKLFKQSFSNGKLQSIYDGLKLIVFCATVSLFISEIF